MQALPFSKHSKLNWQFGLLLILLFGIPRFWLVLEANHTGNYRFIAIIFVLMVITPYLFLGKEGRKTIGIKKPEKYHWLLISFVLGILFCGIVYVTGIWLYGNSIENWFVYISNSYKGQLLGMTDDTRFTFFIIFAIIGMTFSPIGEEFLYRGLIHKSFSTSFGDKNARYIDSTAFALTHLAHFGIVYIAAGFTFLPLPAALWVAFMFLSGLLFAVAKLKTGSIWGAVACHAGFNLAMTWFVFYRLL